MRPPRTATGMPVASAFASPVTAFVNPGPAVTAATPVRPVQRAHASAMCTAPLSWRVLTVRMPSRAQPLTTGAMWPPGRKNTVSHAGVGEHAGDRHPAVVLGHGRRDPRGRGQQRVGGSPGAGGLVWVGVVCGGVVCGGLVRGGGHVVAAHGR